MRMSMCGSVAGLVLSTMLVACGGGGSDAAPAAGLDERASADGLFSPKLTIAIAGSGSVSASNGFNCAKATCSTVVSYGTKLALTAKPVAGWSFSGWTGACTGTAVCNITLDKARGVTATFKAEPVAALTDPNGSPVTGGCAIPRGTSAAPAFAANHPKIFVNHAPTLTCLQQLMSSNAATATRLKSYVDSEMASPGRNWGYENWHAALMFQATGQTSYADFAVAKMDAFVASEEAKIAAGERPVVSGDSYLYVGDIVGDVALVYDWCFSRLTPAQRTRWIAYMNQSVSNVWNPGTASWGGRSFPWSGWSVDNPSNNYYYSFLRATMLVGLSTRGENASAQGWIDQFRTSKIANQLIPTFNRDLAGGGSREGTGYGVAMKRLFQIYDWWERSTGERIATLTPHTLASEAWMLHSIVPTLDYLVARGDQARESSAALFDYHREYLLSLMSLFPQERLSTVAKMVLDASSVPQMQSGFEIFADYLYQPPALPAASLADLSTTYWGSGTGQLMVRSSWTDKTAAYANLACGPFTESHAHRDQGSFQIYRGEWLAPTGNIYSHSGIDQQEGLNNLVLIQQNGSTIRQVVGSGQCNLAALADNDRYTYALAKVTPVYNGHAAISKVEREYVFIKPSTFVVFDRAASVSGTRRVWTLNLPNAPVISGDRLTYTGAKGNKLDVFRAAPAGLSYQVSTPVLEESSDTWLNANVKRVEVVDVSGAQSNFLHVLGTNSSVSSVLRSDTSGFTGAQITLADGRVALVRFSNTGTGGTLEIKQGSTVQVTGALPTTVVAPALFVR